VRDVLFGKGVPDPRDVRKYDLLGAFGLVDARALRGTLAVQALADAEALLFLEKNFDELFNRMTADEVAATLKRELARLSRAGVVAVLKQPRWTDVQRRLLARALPVPFDFTNLMMTAEGTAAASNHPGDWRFQNFDYE
jgi:hypothetical protein